MSNAVGTTMSDCNFASSREFFSFVPPLRRRRTSRAIEGLYKIRENSAPLQLLSLRTIYVLGVIVF